MEERRLENIAWAVSLVGILLMLFMSEIAGAKESVISEIDEGMEGEEVMVKAEVTKVSRKEGITILDIADGTGNIKVAALGDRAPELAEGDGVVVYGSVKIYNGKLEIDASQIRR